MKIEDMTCCSWHSPRNAIVNIRTGAPVPREVLDRIPPGKAKDDMMYSGNMCDPCAKKFAGGEWAPMNETIMDPPSGGRGGGYSP